MREAMIVATVFLSTVAMAAQSAGGLRWTVPAGWKTEVAQPMRAATYSVAAAPGDKAGGECIVSFFGAGQGGSVDANIERWRNQIQVRTDSRQKQISPNKPSVVFRSRRSTAQANIGRWAAR